MESGEMGETRKKKAPEGFGAKEEKHQMHPCREYIIDCTHTDPQSK